MIIHADDTNFTSEVLESNLPVLVDFFTSWCGPCKMLAPILEELEAKYAGRLKVVKVNAEEAMDISGAYDIMSVPTLIMFVNGQPLDELDGVPPLARLEEFIGKYI